MNEEKKHHVFSIIDSVMEEEGAKAISEILKINSTMTELIVECVEEKMGRVCLVKD